MRVAITGAAGLLGSELARQLGAMGCEPAAFSRADLDITDEESVHAALVEASPDVVFNCAAYTQVDGCEVDEARAFAVNAAGAGAVARASAACGARLIHISTDHVFDGTKGAPYVEDDASCPVNAYGRSKRAGEELVLETCQNALVVRTSWLYGVGGPSFVATMLGLGRTREYVDVVDDQFGCLTNAADLAAVLCLLAQCDMTGICHAAGMGVASWADVAEAVFEEAGIACSVNRCGTETYRLAHPQSAPRPRYAALSTERLGQAGLRAPLRPWREALADYVNGASL